MSPNHPSQNLTAYYKTTWGAFLLILGLAIALYSLWLITQPSGTSIPMVIVGLATFVCGCYCLHRPCFRLEPRQLTVYNLLGVTTKRYTFDSWEVVKADNRRIYIDRDGITIKVSVSPWMVNSEDWTAMRKML